MMRPMFRQSRSGFISLYFWRLGRTARSRSFFLGGESSDAVRFHELKTKRNKTDGSKETRKSVYRPYCPGERSVQIRRPPTTRAPPNDFFPRSRPPESGRGDRVSTRSGGRAFRSNFSFAPYKRQSAHRVAFFPTLTEFGHECSYPVTFWTHASLPSPNLSGAHKPLIPNKTILSEIQWKFIL